MTSTIERYRESVSLIPAPGGGCHTALLSIANRGIRAGLSESDIFHDIRTAVPSGRRHVPDNEIIVAIRKAAGDSVKGSFIPTYHKPAKPIDGMTALKRVIDQSKADNEADLWELSPIRIDWEPSEDAWRFLLVCFDSDEYIFIGDRHEAGISGKNIRTVSEWIDFFQSGGKAGPFIIINPLTGKAAPIKSGDGETYRGDGCISFHRYALGEFDNLSKGDQIRFWTGAKLPIKALIDSGGKSVHAWLKVDIADAERWDREVKEKLYRQALTPMGIDSACSNAARLARLPGCLRGDKWQRLLYMGDL